jgi:hypothetical protein
MQLQRFFWAFNFGTRGLQIAGSFLLGMVFSRAERLEVED